MSIVIVSVYLSIYTVTNSNCFYDIEFIVAMIVPYHIKLDI